jgi:hypothetical protein
VNEQLLDGTVVELMMPVQSRRQGDELLVDNVDLKRAARNLINKTKAPGWTPPSDLNQAMELMASCFGYANLLAVNKQANAAPQLPVAPVEESARVALENATTNVLLTAGPAVGKGMSLHPAPDTFPVDLGPKFDQRWKNLASAGFYASLAGVAHSGDIVAIIGRPGSGKSLLVNAMAKSMAGAIVDFRLKTWQEDFDRVRRAPPSLVFIEELYHRSEATEMEVAAFALGAKSTKTVFVFQNYDTLVQSMLSRRDPAGKPLFALARVLDLDRMTLNTVYSQEPMSYDEWQSHESRAGAAEKALKAPLPGATDLVRELQAYAQRDPSSQIPVIVAADDVDAQDTLNLVLGSGAVSKASVINCRGNMSTQLFAAMRNAPDIIIFDRADKVPTSTLAPELHHAINTGHRVCLRIEDPAWMGQEMELGSKVAIGEMVVRSGFRTAEQNDQARNAPPAASAHAPATRRKPRP